MTMREEAKAATRERVVTAARDLFIANGYEATTIRGIAKAIGMSTGAIFACFPDKPSLYVAAMKRPEPEVQLAAVPDLVSSLKWAINQAEHSLVGTPGGRAKYDAAKETLRQFEEVA